MNTLHKLINSTDYSVDQISKRLLESDVQSFEVSLEDYVDELTPIDFITAMKSGSEKISDYISRVLNRVVWVQDIKYSPSNLRFVITFGEQRRQSVPMGRRTIFEFDSMSSTRFGKTLRRDQTHRIVFQLDPNVIQKKPVSNTSDRRPIQFCLYLYPVSGTFKLTTVRSK